MQYDVTAIKEMIPHRYPFLLVDKVVDIVKGESGTGIKCVTINEPFFPGHFPDQPVMPGVLILEAMAQTAGVIAIDSLGDDAKGSKAVFFMGIDGAKFRKTVVPGDRLEMKVTVLRGGGAVWKFQGEAYVEGTKVCEATLTAMMGGN